MIILRINKTDPSGKGSSAKDPQNLSKCERSTKHRYCKLVNIFFDNGTSDTNISRKKCQTKNITGNKKNIAFKELIVYYKTEFLIKLYFNLENKITARKKV